MGYYMFSYLYFFPFLNYPFFLFTHLPLGPRVFVINLHIPFGVDNICIKSIWTIYSTCLKLF